MSGSCGCENSNCKCAESYSTESNIINIPCIIDGQEAILTNDPNVGGNEGMMFLFEDNFKWSMKDDLWKEKMKRLNRDMKKVFNENNIPLHEGVSADDYGIQLKKVDCSHDNLGIKTMEQLNGELLLTLVCDACGKRTSTSAPIESDAWDAESFAASVVNKGKVPQGAIAKAMMNRAMITQVSIESVIQELENKVNLGLISEDELMKSLKKKFGAEYDIQVFNSRYGYDHIECGKCGGSHKGYCPDYGKEEDEYNQCTDCKWDGANGNWNTVIEWCSSCKEKNEIEAKRNAERIRLEKEREEQEERDFQESEKYSREQGDIWEDRYLAESNRLSNPGQFRKYMEELPFPDNMENTKELGFIDKNGNTVEIYIGSGGSNNYDDEGVLEWWVVSNWWDDKPLRPNQEAEVKQFLNDYLRHHGVPKYELFWRNRYDDEDGDESDVFITLNPLPAAEEKLWKSLWENKSRKTGSCSHDDFEIETIEKDGSDYLLTFKCLGCKKVGSTSAELQDNEWMD